MALTLTVFKMRGQNRLFCGGLGRSVAGLTVAMIRFRLVY
jgi:hypothetical protein